MRRLYYCYTNKNIDPPIDVNPLIYKAFPDCKILVLASCEEERDRIVAFVNQDEKLIGKVSCIMWNQLFSIGLITSENTIDMEKLLEWNIIVVVNKQNLICETYLSYLKSIDQKLNHD